MNKKAAAAICFCAAWCVSSLIFAGVFRRSRSFTLDSGCRVYIEQSQRSPLAYIAMAIGAGAQYENHVNAGSFHLIEHQILFGRGAYESRADKYHALRAHGAYFNAHTEHDVITVEITVPAQHAAWAIAFLGSEVLQARFNDADLALEKPIVLEELKQHQDDPQRVGRALVLAQLFSAETYGRSLLGSQESIAAATAASLQEIHRQWFDPRLCALVIIAASDGNELEKIVRSSWSAFKTAATPVPPISPPMPTPNATKAGITTCALDIAATHLFIGFPAPALQHPDRQILDTLLYALTRGANPIFYRLINDSAAIANAIDSTYLAFKHSGAVIFHIQTSPDNLPTVQRKLNRAWPALARYNYSKTDSLPDNQYFSFDYLASAKSNLLFAFERGWENDMDSALAYARFLAISDTSLAAKSLQLQLQATQSDDLRQIAQKYLQARNAFCVLVEPKPKKQT